MQLLLTIMAALEDLGVEVMEQKEALVEILLLLELMALQTLVAVAVAVVP